MKLEVVFVQNLKQFSVSSTILSSGSVLAGNNNKPIGCETWDAAESLCKVLLDLAAALSAANVKMVLGIFVHKNVA